MKIADVEDMELGNLIFGNSRGEYAVRPRELYQDAFCRFLYDNGFDGYGTPPEGVNDWFFENDTFIVRPYYWGEDEAIAALPNFVYKPENFELSWYKYPMRDAYCNKDVDIEWFKNILTECEKSLMRID